MNRYGRVRRAAAGAEKPLRSIDARAGVPIAGGCLWTRLRSATIVIAVAALSVGGAPRALAASHAITWLAAGDSYASGAGLPDTTVCARATGGSQAWATVAASDLSRQGDAVSPPRLVACTGAIENEFFSSQGPRRPAEWSRAMGRYDLVTFSFGGDDVGFVPILESCLAQKPTCSDATVVPTISAVGAGYPAFLLRVADNAVVPGGNVVVMEYPYLFENPALWPAHNRLLRECDGLSLPDTELVRNWAMDLNAAIGGAVTRTNALPPSLRNDVTFTFIDPVTGEGSQPIPNSDANLFEPADGPDHELCSEGADPWLNGIVANHLTKSFHPNQAGERAMGNLAAEVVSQLRWPQNSARAGAQGS